MTVAADADAAGGGGDTADAADAANAVDRATTRSTGSPSNAVPAPAGVNASGCTRTSVV